MQKVVGTLSKEEGNNILDIYERKIALENLMKVLDPEKDELYEKLIKDYGSVVRAFDEWWLTNSKKNNWEGKTWFINFQTNEVILINNSL
jgi:CXXX repeat modification system protein